LGSLIEDMISLSAIVSLQAQAWEHVVVDAFAIFHDRAERMSGSDRCPMEVTARWNLASRLD
jgi:hypothetical protein